MRERLTMTISEMFDDYSLSDVYATKDIQASLAGYHDALYSNIPAELVIEVWVEVIPEVVEPKTIVIDGKRFKLVPDEDF